MSHSRAFLVAKRLLFPGTDVAVRQRLRFVRHFRDGDIATLDVGCGNGAFSLAAYRLGNRVLGVDRDPENIARCREYAAFVGVDPSRCRFEVANVYELDALDETFEQAIAFEILEHLQRDDEAVRGLAGRLGPGGVLHVSSPYADRRPYAGEVLSDREDGGHVRLGYTRESFDVLLRGAGLDPVLHDQAVGPASRALLELVNRAEERGGRAAGVAALVGGLPVTLADRLPGRTDYGRALIVYAQGVKRAA